MSRPSYATENWLRTQLRLREERITELEVALRYIQSREPSTPYDYAAFVRLVSDIQEVARVVLTKAVAP